MWFSFLLWNDISTLPAQKLCSSYYILVLFVYYIRLIFHYYSFRFIVFLNKLYVRTYIWSESYSWFSHRVSFINIIVLEEGRWDLRLLLLLLDIYYYYTYCDLMLAKYVIKATVLWVVLTFDFEIFENQSVWMLPTSVK